MIGALDRLPPLDPDLGEDPPTLDVGEVLVAHRDHDDGAYGSCTGDLIVKRVYGRLAEFECNEAGCRHNGSILIGSVNNVRRRAAEYRDKIDRRFDR